MKKQYISPVSKYVNLELDATVAGGIQVGSIGIDEGWVKEEADFSTESESDNTQESKSLWDEEW